jgi:hypothetical protein
MQPDVDYSSEFVTVNAWVELKEGGNISPCQVYGKGNIMDIKQIDENTVTVDCVQVDELQREILRIPEGITKQELDLLDERFANDKHEYVFCEVLVDGLPIRRRLDVKKVGTYHKKQVKYVPVMEEQMFHKKQYGENITYTGIPKLYWFDRKIVNGEMESKYITVTLFDILDKIIV